jgi:hypothetical protein
MSASSHLDTLRAGAEDFLRELAREEYLTLAGLKPGAELQPIYARHARAIDEEALAAAREAWLDAADGTEERRAAALLLEWLAEQHASRQLAAHDERLLTWEASAVVSLEDGRQLPYQRASIAMANASDRAERLLVERGRARLVERELAPMRRERLLREQELIAGLGLADGYVPTFTALTGIDLAGLAAQCEAFLRDTDAMWDDVSRELFRTRLGLAPGQPTRADALHLFRLGAFDHGFPARDMEQAVRRQVGEMGLSADAQGRVVYDTGEREGKRARAFCSPVRVPDEVYLVLRPFGGQQDWATLLHELGHALHFAYMDPALPTEARWMGDNSVTEGWAMLFDHLMHDRRWLARYTALDPKDVPAFRRAAGASELHMLRRYAAKLLYELSLYGGDTPWDALPDLYVQRLGDATAFRYMPADAFVDVDARFYSARYLRAWQLQAVVTRTLVERFDEDWFRNPSAGPWVRTELFAPGQRERGDEVAQRVAGEALSFAPLVRAVEEMLA